MDQVQKQPSHYSVLQDFLPLLSYLIGFIEDENIRFFLKMQFP